MRKIVEALAERAKAGDPAAVRFVQERLASDPQRVMRANEAGFYEPVPETLELKSQYQREAGLPTARPKDIRQLDVDKSKRIADAFEEMRHAPNDPAVRRSYDALAREASDQYQKLLDAGVEFDYWRGRGEPYKNSREMAADVRDNRQLKVLATEGNFGQDAITPEELANNPMLAKTEFKDKDGKPLLVNDVFRAVHDYFGHGSTGTGFGAVGEEGAWAAHARMFSPEARKALTTETRGQNSWVNFGKQLRRPDGTLPQKGDPDWVPPGERAFADQKIGLLPEEFSEQEYYRLINDPGFQEMMKKVGFVGATGLLMAYPEAAEGSILGQLGKVDDVMNIIKRNSEKTFSNLEAQKIVKADPVVSHGMNPHASDKAVNYDNLIRYGWLSPENLNDPSQVKRAVTRYRNAWDNNPSFKRSEQQIHDQSHEITGDPIDKKIITPSEMEGRVVTPIMGDQSKAGQVLNTYRGIPMERPVNLHGGAEYPLLNEQGWESMKGAASGAQRQIDFMADRFGDDVFPMYSAMSPQATDFSVMPASTMVQFARNNPAISKKDKQLFDREFNNFLKKQNPKGGNKQWVGIDDPRALDQIYGENSFPKEGSGAFRKQLVNFMSKKNWKDKGFATFDDEMKRTMNIPELEAVDTGDMGFSIWQGKPGAELLDNPQTDSYSHVIQGKGLGGFEESIPPEFVIPDEMERLSGMTNVAGKPFTKSQQVGAFRARQDVGQRMTPKAVDLSETYLENIKALKESSDLPETTIRATAKELTDAKVNKRVPDWNKISQAGFGGASLTAMSGLHAMPVDLPEAGPEEMSLYDQTMDFWLRGNPALEAGVIGAGKGFTDIGRLAKKAYAWAAGDEEELARLDAEKEREQRYFDEGVYQDHPIAATVGEVGAEFMATLPAGISSAAAAAKAVAPVAKYAPRVDDYARAVAGGAGQGALWGATDDAALEGALLEGGAAAAGEYLVPKYIGRPAKAAWENRDKFLPGIRGLGF